jgi:hypothetical protein
MPAKLLLAGVIAVVTTASAAWAQFTQYAAPGSLAPGEESTKERLQKAMEQARWTLGPLRLEPWVGLGKLTYHDDLEPWQEGKQSDVTASAGAGVTAFLPLRQGVLLAGYALPEYSWWRERNKRSRLNGRYGVGAFADLGRLSLDLKGFRASEPWYIGFENEVPIDVRREGVSLGAELRLLRRLFIYATAEETHWRYRDEDLAGAPLPRLRSLDRDERATTVGLRYRFQEQLSLSLGSRRSQNDFVLTDFNRSNSGSAPTLGLQFTGRRLTLNADVSKYDLKPSAGSAFSPFEGRTGRAQVQWKLGHNSGVSLYTRKLLAFTFGGLDYYTVETKGAGLQFAFGWRAKASVFGERGSHTFVGGSRPDEDRRVYGATANMSLWRRSSLALHWERQNYDDVEGRNVRNYNRFTAGLEFGFGSAVTW